MFTGFYFDRARKMVSYIKRVIFCAFDKALESERTQLPRYGERYFVVVGRICKNVSR